MSSHKKECIKEQGCKSGIPDGLRPRYAAQDVADSDPIPVSYNPFLLFILFCGYSFSQIFCECDQWTT